jgi:hypothetical protein
MLRGAMPRRLICVCGDASGVPGAGETVSELGARGAGEASAAAGPGRASAAAGHAANALAATPRNAIRRLMLVARPRARLFDLTKSLIDVR